MYIFVVVLSQGQHLQRGSRLVDFDIRVGDAACVPVSLTDSQVECRPPTNSPNRDSNCSVYIFSVNVRIRGIYREALLLQLDELQCFVTMVTVYVAEETNIY